MQRTVFEFAPAEVSAIALPERHALASMTTTMLEALGVQKSFELAGDMGAVTEMLAPPAAPYMDGIPGPGISGNSTAKGFDLHVRLPYHQYGTHMSAVADLSYSLDIHRRVRQVLRGDTSQVFVAQITAGGLTVLSRGEADAAAVTPEYAATCAVSGIRRLLRLGVPAGVHWLTE